jgi:HAD superfamily hydrolase (TIGR01509 family)
MALRSLLFDFDGLLCDTEEAARTSWCELYARHGHTFPGTVWQQMMGNPEGEAVAMRHLADLIGRPLTGEEIADRRRRKAALAATAGLRPGVERLCDAAADRGLALAVVSGSGRDWVHGHLVRLNVAHRFTAVVTGDDEGRRKPAPDPYLLALRAVGARADEAVAFEDSPTGVRAALAAGIRCFAVPGPAGDPGDFPDVPILKDLAAFLPEVTR